MQISRLKQRMIDEIDLRGLSSITKKIYLKAMWDLSNFHNKTPDLLDVKDIKKYQLHLIKVRKLAPNSVNQRLTGIRFFYKYVMERYWYPSVLPRVKAKRKLPIILTEEEIGRMIDSVDKLRFKAILMLLYSSALRNSELRNLKISNIDSDRMLIDVEDGKGGIDRKALLTPITLKYLRLYWQVHRLKKEKSQWLFVPEGGRQSKSGALSHTALDYIIKTAAREANVKKKFTIIFFSTPMEPIF